MTTLKKHIYSIGLVLLFVGKGIHAQEPPAHAAVPPTDSVAMELHERGRREIQSHNLRHANIILQEALSKAAPDGLARKLVQADLDQLKVMVQISRERIGEIHAAMDRAGQRVTKFKTSLDEVRAENDKLEALSRANMVANKKRLEDALVKLSALRKQRDEVWEKSRQQREHERSDEDDSNDADSGRKLKIQLRHLDDDIREYTNITQNNSFEPRVRREQVTQLENELSNEENSLNRLKHEAQELEASLPPAPAPPPAKTH